MSSNKISVFDFSMPEKNALCNIYKEEIKTAFQKVSFIKVLQPFVECFDKSELRKIEGALATKGDGAGKDEIYKFVSKAHDARVFVQFVVLMSKHDSDLADKLKCVGVYDLKRYQQVLAAYHVFNLLADAEFLTTAIVACGYSCFGADSSVGQNIMDVLLAEGAATFESTVRALAIFLQQLPRHNPDWYWLFMRALGGDGGPHGMQLRDAINKNFEEELARHEYEKVAVPAEKWTVVDADEALARWLRAAAGGDSTDILASSNNDNESGKRKLTNGDSDSNAKVLKTGFSLRNYQIELASAAVQQKNSVICAPTGSGKTFMAVEIIQRHFENYSKQKKVAFLVPTTQLVDQQFDVMKSNLSTSLRIKRMKGGSASAAAKTPKVESVLVNDVIVTTPQVLLNILKDSTAREPVKLTTFSLLVLDECHHTDKDHPYNELMVQYSDIKFGRPQDAKSLPQIVGLTASLGVGKADDEIAARQHVVHVAANMDAEVLSTISDQHLNELAEFVNVPVDRVEPVKQPPRPLTLLIESVMKKIEKLADEDFKILKSEIDALLGKGASAQAAATDKCQLSLIAPAQKSGPQYTGWVCNWLVNIPKFKGSSAKVDLTSALEHLRVYHMGLDLNAHVPSEQALRYLAERLDEFERKQSSDRDRQLVTIYKQDFMAIIKANPTPYAIKNHLVEKLTEILMKELCAKGDGRALVFVRTRDLTIALEEYMRNESRLKSLNASRLTGAQASKEKGGQTMKEQQDLLERFRSGEHKVLIATTVAEEGLDVEKCHLVIKYNHVTNEISMVQRRGRGRAVGSESILLVQDNWIEEKEETNILREYLMRKAVSYIRSQGETKFREQVKKEQLDEYKKRCIERALAEKNRQAVAGNLFEILCKKCDKFLLSSKDVRRASCHYVGVDPKIWERLCAEPNNAMMFFETMIIAGKVSCSGCRTDIGNVIRYMNTYLATLKIESTSLKRIQPPPSKTEGLLHVRKWIKVVPSHFYVDDVENSDLREMYTALDRLTTDKFDKSIDIQKVIQQIFGQEDEDEND